MNETMISTARMNELLKAEDQLERMSNKYWEAQWFIGELHQCRS